MYILFGENNPSRRRVPIHLVDSTDGITPKTGQTGTAKLSTNYGAPTTSKNSIVEIDSTNLPGDYYLELDPSEIVNPGNLLVRVKTAVSAEYVYPVQVVAFDPYQPVSLQPGFNAAVAGADIDYRRIDKVVREALATLPKPVEPKEVDFSPLSDSLQAILSEIRDLADEEDEEVDLTPVIAKIEVVDRAVKAIRVPEYDDSAVLARLDTLSDSLESYWEQLSTVFAELKTALDERNDTDDSLREIIAKLNDALDMTKMRAAFEQINLKPEDKPPRFEKPKLMPL